MKKYLILLVGLAWSMVVSARPQQRAVVVDTICNAPLAEVLKLSGRFCRQFQSCPDSLNYWAYQGLAEEEDTTKKKTKESRDAIQLRYKDRVYDPVHKTGDVAIDIYVLGVRWWKDQHLGTKYTQTRPANAQYPITSHMTATYSGSILEGGDYIMVLEPISETQTRIHYEFRLVFGRVLSAFISDKMWQSAIEWRFYVILENLIECAETGTVQPKHRGPEDYRRP